MDTDLGVKSSAPAIGSEAVNHHTCRLVSALRLCSRHGSEWRLARSILAVNSMARGKQLALRGWQVYQDTKAGHQTSILPHFVSAKRSNRHQGSPGTHCSILHARQMCTCTCMHEAPNHLLGAKPWWIIALAVCGISTPQGHYRV